jgi:hypothetical protein
MLDQLREGDVVVISRLDRLARSTGDLLELCEEMLPWVPGYARSPSYGQTRLRPPAR